MKIQTLIYTFIVFIALSCNKKLDKVPESQLTDATFWKSTNDLEKAANYFYNFLPSIWDNLGANLSDDAFNSSTGPNPISNGSRLTPTTDQDWTDSYKLIRACNNLLEKSQNVSGDINIINRFRGEAFFFRGFAYSNLLKRYGAVPLILRTFGINDSLTQSKRSDRNIIIQTIYKDLDSATAYLPLPSKLPLAQYGRITSSAALAFKSTIALFEGTFEKFHQLGADYKSHLNIALKSSKSVIDSKEYNLYQYSPIPDSSYYYTFQYAAEGPGKENIIVRLYGKDLTDIISVHDYPNNIVAGTNTAPTRSIMDDYLYVDGLPKGKSLLEVDYNSTLSEFQNRDPRMAMTVFKKTDWLYTSYYVPTLANAITGYKQRKYMVVQDILNDHKSFLDNIYLRYAEILLTYAEAAFELNNNITDSDLDISINLLRKRVKMPYLTNSFVTSNSLDMRQEIRRERRIELAFEGQHRYWDLIRWKTAENILPNAVLGAKYFPKEFVGNSNPKLTPEGYIIVESADKRKFDPAKDYLWPIPIKELGLDLNLTQNPGW